MTAKKTCPTCPKCGEDHDDWQDDINGVVWGELAVALCCACLTPYTFTANGFRTKALPDTDPRLQKRWFIRCAHVREDGGRGRARHADKVAYGHDEDGVLQAEAERWGFTSCSTYEEAQADLELLRPWAASHRPGLFLWVESVMVPKRPMQEAPLPPVFLPQGWEPKP